MASNIDFVNYVMEQINDTGIVSQKKMFGEYMVYVNQKPIILICDNVGGEDSPDSIILRVNITKATVIKDHGAVVYIMDFVNKKEQGEMH